MKIICGWDEELYRSICRKSGSQQAVDDVGYMRLVVNRTNLKTYAARLDDIACIFGYFKKEGLRIICIAVDKEHKNQGIGSALLLNTMRYCMDYGIGKIVTRTQAGKDFYLKYGFEIVGKKGSDYMMEVFI